MVDTRESDDGRSGITAVVSTNALMGGAKAGCVVRIAGPSGGFGVETGAMWRRPRNPRAACVLTYAPVPASVS